MALDIAAGRAARNASLTRSDRIEPMGEALAVIEFARAQVGANCVCVCGGGSPRDEAAAAVCQRPRAAPHPLPPPPPPPRAQAAKRARNLTHPQLCLDAIQAGVTNGGAAGLKKARRAAPAPLRARGARLRVAAPLLATAAAPQGASRP